MSLPLTRRQPFKGLYIGYLVLSVVFIRLPWWFVRSIPRRNRPRRTWPLLRCVMVTAYREILSKLALNLGLTTSRKPPTSVDELKNAKFIWIEGLSEDSDAYCGEVRRAAGITGVRSAKVPAYWVMKSDTTFPEGMKAKEGEKTVLHIHGGAFYMGSAHPDSPTANLSHGILAHSSALSRVLGVDYRLSAASPDPPANPFPTALLDSLAAYAYLVRELSFQPQNITIAGDSAGANIAFSLVRHLVENSIATLPPPGGLISCSAWLDLSESRNGPEASLTRNCQSDILGGGPEHPRKCYLGILDHNEAKMNRYISPASPHLGTVEGIFEGFPRTLVSAGSAEVLLDDSIVVAERLKKDGVDVVLDVEPDAIHDYTLFPWHEPERTEGLKRIGHWLDT